MPEETRVNEAAPAVAHTPGPWRVAIVWPFKHEALDVRQECVGVKVVEDLRLGSEAMVALCGRAEGGEFEAERYANARLIAAAPTLLHALRVALSHVEFSVRHTLRSQSSGSAAIEDARDDLETVLAAIAQAEGGAE